MAAKTFKADRPTGVTIHWPGGFIRIEAGDTYTTEDPREIEVLEGASGVEEAKPVKKRANAKRQTEDED